MVQEEVSLKSAQFSSAKPLSLQMSPVTVVDLLLMTCVLCGEVCECFPNGSLALSCGDMMPYHPPFSPSTNSPPFTLSTSSATFRPGGMITGRFFFVNCIHYHVKELGPTFCLFTVTLEVSDSASVEFQGFMLQARSMEGKGKIQSNLWEGLVLHCSLIKKGNYSNDLVLLLNIFFPGMHSVTVEPFVRFLVVLDPSVAAVPRGSG